MTPGPRSTIAAPARGVSLAQRASDYFGMSGTAEFIAAVALFALLVVLSVLNMMHREFDSDEPQHLHLIWGWVRGFVQYRDLFDNHMPLFHIMFAPIVGLIGERATILYWMRFLLFPMYFLAAWCTYEIGTRLFSRRAGVWAVIGVAFFSGYYSDAFEFRTDNLWTPTWLLCVTVLIRGAITVRRALVAGLLFGLCFGVSMKPMVFLLSLLVSVPLAIALVGRQKLGKSWAYLAQCAGAFLATTVVIPGVIISFFALKGIWRDFRYAVFDFNLLAARVYEGQIVYKSYPALAFIIFAIALPIVVYVARRIISLTGDPGLAFRRVFIFLVCASYLFTLQIFWPPISRTYPPIYPLACVLLSGALLGLSDRLTQERRDFGEILRWVPLPAFVVPIEFLFLFVDPHPFWKNDTKEEANLLRDVLALTEPSDYVFDCKGETVFRQRCFRPVLERITMKAIGRGIIVDNAPQLCVERQTCVVATIIGQRLSSQTRRFVERNYLPVADNLRVAGAMLKPSGSNPRHSDFQVVIPASYKIISRDGSVSGTLDGIPYEGARFLAAGSHSFESASTINHGVLLWAQAVDRHFTPFSRHTSPDK